jgi:DNA replication factor GINS
LYNEIYKAWKREIESEDIQELSSNFYVNLAGYIHKIKEERRMLDEKTTKAKLLQREFENVEKIAKNLVQLRYEKCLELMKDEKTIPSGVLTDEEEKMRNEILPLSDFYQAFLKELLKGSLSSLKWREKKKYLILRFLQPIPAIIGPDMKTYGPFKAEDLATLPTQNARILIKQGAAVEVEAK